MQYLDSIYALLDFFGTQKNNSVKRLNLLQKSSLIWLFMKTVFKLENLGRRYCHLSSISGSNLGKSWFS